MPGMTRRRVVSAVSIAVIVAVVALVVVLLMPGPATTTITADFAEAPGLFVGNHVDILGVPVGTVTSVRATAADVVVRMKIPTAQAIPRDVRAVLMAPDVVNDRFVQLQPAYTSGPRLGAGATIPTARTAVPISVDQVFDSLDQLSKALGPQGANKNGALSLLVAKLAKSLGGNGSNLHRAVVETSQALTGVASSPKQLKDILTNLGQLTQAAADNTTSYQSFANDLAGVSTSLAGDDADIAGALSGLQQLFANLTQFVQQDQSSLGGSVANLQAFATRLASQQAALAQAFDVGPLALQNLAAAVDPDAPGGAALKGRYDQTPASTPLEQSVCGNQLLRGLVVATNPTARTELDVDCVFNGALGSLTPSAGSSTGPDVALGALLGAP
jgi:phospholipid/cholesterol/gamma-HCH transport system substrate-binding protein